MNSAIDNCEATALTAIRHRHGLELHTHVPPGSGPTHHR